MFLFWATAVSEYVFADSLSGFKESGLEYYFPAGSQQTLSPGESGYPARILHCQLKTCGPVTGPGA